jgi:hypothetical protein
MSTCRKLFVFFFVLILITAAFSYYHRQTKVSVAPTQITEFPNVNNHKDDKLTKEISGTTTNKGSLADLHFYTNNEFGFTLQYPKDWNLKEGSTTPGGYVKAKEEYEVVLKKQDYEINILISHTPKGGFISSPYNMTYVGTVENTRVYRKKEPMAEFEGLVPQFEVGFYEKVFIKNGQEEYSLNSDLFHTGLYFSINYYILGSNTE